MSVIINAANIAQLPASIIHTMPWQHQVYRPGQIRVIDRFGKEVPMDVMISFLQSASADVALNYMQQSASSG